MPGCDHGEDLIHDLVVHTLASLDDLPATHEQTMAAVDRYPQACAYAAAALLCGNLQVIAGDLVGINDPDELAAELAFALSDVFTGGLDPQDVSTAEELAMLLAATGQPDVNPRIRLAALVGDDRDVLIATLDVLAGLVALICDVADQRAADVLGGAVEQARSDGRLGPER